MAGQFSSTARTCARQAHRDRSPERFVVRKGDALGVSHPANGVLLALVKLLENAARRAG